MTKTVTCPRGHAHIITTERRQVGEAYARNGNLHNPTPRYHYDVMVDGKIVASYPRLGYGVEIASDFITTGEVDG